MSLLALVAALLIEQWRPLANRGYLYSRAARYANFIERKLNAEEAEHGAIAWLLAVLPPVAGAWLVYSAATRISPVLGLLVNVAALYVTMGFRQRSHYFTEIHLALKDNDLARARRSLAAWRGASCDDLDQEAIARLTIEEALIASHRYVFGVAFWFVLLPGPIGAVLYRAARFLAQRWCSPETEPFGRFAGRIFLVIDWLPVRCTAAAFAVVGDFEDAVHCWRTQAGKWPDPLLGVVLAAGAGAMGVRLGMSVSEHGEIVSRPELGLGDDADTAHLDSTVGLVWRSLVMWLALFMALGIAAALS
jgi:cobalamin biosynthesis protein CobD/CbiB